MELICQFLGYSGGLLLAICGGFEAYRAVRSKEYSISIPFVVTWFTGEILTLIPLVVESNRLYLIMNYSMNILFISVIIGRLIKDRFKKADKIVETVNSSQFRLCYRPERNDKNG